MHFEFSRATQPEYSVEGFGVLNDWTVMKVTQEQKLIGQLYYHKKICFLDFEDQELRINIDRHFFKKTRAAIIDRKTGTDIGDVVINPWRQSSGEHGQMKLGDTTYTGQELRPDIISNPFKKSTWGHYKFRTFSQSEEAVYAFSIGSKHMSTATFPDGKIFLSNNNRMLLFCGLYLLEERLKYGDE